MTDRPLTPAEKGRLGGLASAHAAGAEELARRGSKGGQATLKARGREHYVRAAYARWKRLPANSSRRPREAA